jgi:hypothetical protein
MFHDRNGSIYDTKKHFHFFRRQKMIAFDAKIRYFPTHAYFHFIC